jgi:hypothetical protein
MKKIAISQVDTLFASGMYPVEFLFYYGEAFPTKRLRAALRRLSSAFWPMFGTYENGAIRAERYREEYYYDEETAGAEFDVSAVESQAVDADFRFRLPDSKRLFFLKVLRPNNGLVLIPKMSHIAGDGYSYFYFLSLLATLSRSARIPFKSRLTILSLKPHHRRTALKDFSFRDFEPAPATPDERYAIASEEILRKDVKSVIRDAASSGEPRISMNDVLTAVAVKQLAGRQPSRWGESVEVTVPIDVRPYVKEYGPKFFGNGIWLHPIKLRKDDIMNLPPKVLAIQIRTSMPLVSKETYTNYLVGLEDIIAGGEKEKLRPYNPERGCLVTNLSRLPSDKLDFGSGGPASVIPLTVEKNSTAILAKNENFLLRYGY